MTNLPKGIKVDTSKIQPVERIHMDFDFYNVTSICGFTSMRTVVCAKTRMIWVFPTAYKIPPVIIICFALTTFKN